MSFVLCVCCECVCSILVVYEPFLWLDCRVDSMLHNTPQNWSKLLLGERIGRVCRMALLLLLLGRSWCALQSPDSGELNFGEALLRLLPFLPSASPSSFPLASPTWCSPGALGAPPSQILMGACKQPDQIGGSGFTHKESRGRKRRRRRRD